MQNLRSRQAKSQRKGTRKKKEKRSFVLDSVVHLEDTAVENYDGRLADSKGELNSELSGLRGTPSPREVLV